MSTVGDEGRDTLIGSFFHSLLDGAVEWQGLVIGSPQPGWYFVNLYEWVGGAPSVRRLVRIEQMAGWLFYATLDDMKFNYEHRLSHLPLAAPQ